MKILQSRSTYKMVKIKERADISSLLTQNEPFIFLQYQHTSSSLFWYLSFYIFILNIHF